MTIVTVSSSPAFALREALGPLYRRFTTERTLSIGKTSVLNELTEHGPLTASALATAGRISPQAVTVVIRELEGLGLVSRTRDSEDRRRVWISVTDAGRQKLADERSSVNSWLARAIAEKLTDAERAVLVAAIPVLAKITKENGSA